MNKMADSEGSTPSSKEKSVKRKLVHVEDENTAPTKQSKVSEGKISKQMGTSERPSKTPSEDDRGYKNTSKGKRLLPSSNEGIADNAKRLKMDKEEEFPANDNRSFEEEVSGSQNTEGKSKPHRQRMKFTLNCVREQMEFYFSDSSLSKDRFLKNLVDNSSDGSVDLCVFANFNKLQSLHKDGISRRVLVQALSHSTMLQLNDDKTRVRRVTPFKKISQEETDRRTVYVEHLPSHATHSWMRQTFSQCGKVVYISLPTYRTTKQIKGFAFVEFDSSEEADRACGMLNNPLPEKVMEVPGKFPRGSKDFMRLQRLAPPITVEKDTEKTDTIEGEGDTETNKTALEAESKKKKKKAKKKKPQEQQTDGQAATAEEDATTQEGKTEVKKKKKKKKRKLSQCQDQTEGVESRDKDVDAGKTGGVEDAGQKSDADQSSSQQAKKRKKKKKKNKGDKLTEGEATAKTEVKGQPAGDLSTDKTSGQRHDASQTQTVTPGVAQNVTEHVQKTCTDPAPDTTATETTASDLTKKISPSSTTSEQATQKTSAVSEQATQKTRAVSEQATQKTSAVSEQATQKTSAVSEQATQKTSAVSEQATQKTTPERRLSHKERKLLRQEDIRRKRQERLEQEQKMDSEQPGGEEQGNGAAEEDKSMADDSSDISQRSSILKLKKAEKKRVEFDPVPITTEFVEARGARKRKKPRREKCHLRVIPKREWVSLKEAYIRQQKSHMQALKESLRELRQQENAGKPQKAKPMDLEDVFGNKPPKVDQQLKLANVEKLSFVPNVIVQWWCTHEMHRDKIRTMFKESHAQNIAYIDANEEARSGYIRFKDETSAEEFAKMSRNSTSFMARVLPVEQQEEYWEKANRDRMQKLGRKKKEKGGDKISRQVFQRNKATFSSKPSRIVFDDVDDDAKDGNGEKSSNNSNKDREKLETSKSEKDKSDTAKSDEHQEKEEAAKDKDVEDSNKMS